MFDIDEVISLRDFGSNECSCDESSVEKRVEVGIVQPYANVRMKTKTTKKSNMVSFLFCGHDSKAITP